MIIDSHNHLGGPDKGDGKSQSAAAIISTMDEAGIDKAVVFPFNEDEPGVSFYRCNSYIAKSVSDHPDRLIGFCRLDPNAGAAALTEVERCIDDLGLTGIKLHPSSQNFSLDGSTLHEILAFAQTRRIPVVFDTGKRMSPPAGIAWLASKFPELTIIMAHMNLFEETMVAAESSPNIILGTTGYFNINRLSEAVRRIGSDRIVSGSDSPYLSMRREVEKIERIEGVSRIDIDRMLAGNFLKMHSMCSV